MLAVPDIVIRGTTVVWTVTFTDEAGNTTLPDSAVLHIAYRQSRRPVEQQIPMVQQPDLSWQASWQSGVADAGQLDWHVRSGPAFVAALQGSFRLDTNKANPAGIVTQLSASGLTGGSPHLDTP